jgi:hypothetical protein
MFQAFKPAAKRKYYKITKKFTVNNSVGDPNTHVLGLPDPDPFVRDMDPDLAPSLIS